MREFVGTVYARARVCVKVASMGARAYWLGCARVETVV